MELKKEIEELHKQHPAYGHRRVALALGINKKRALRVMNKYNIYPPRLWKKRKIYTTRAYQKPIHYTNLLKRMSATRNDQVYCSDITYLKFHGRFLYLSVALDIYNRYVVSCSVSYHHDSKLALDTIQDALKRGIPQIWHFDGGSENLSNAVVQYLKMHGIRISVCDKGSPWQNGFVETFFGRFKEEFGNINRFDNSAQLTEAIYLHIAYYNNERIHTVLKTTPLNYRLIMS